VVVVVVVVVVGGDSQALVDRQFKNDLNQAFKAVACALHSYDLEKVVHLVLLSLPHILSRSVASLSLAFSLSR
jgi:hypothetical protein